MKTNFLLSFIFFVLLGLSVPVTAQTEKGSFLLSGSGSLDFASMKVKVESGDYSEESGKISTFEFTPAAGYFVLNNLAVGVQYSMSSTSEKDDGDKYTESTTMLFPFALLYFGKGNVKPFVQAGYGPGWAKLKYDNEKETQKLSGYELVGGLAIFLNQYVSLDLSLGYASAKAIFKSNYNTDIKSTTSGMGGNIGFSVFF